VQPVVERKLAGRVQWSGVGPHQRIFSPIFLQKQRGVARIPSKLNVSAKPWAQRGERYNRTTVEKERNIWCFHGDPELRRAKGTSFRCPPKGDGKKKVGRKRGRGNGRPVEGAKRGCGSFGGGLPCGGANGCQGGEERAHHSERGPTGSIQLGAKNKKKK